MSIAPSPTAAVDELVAGPVPTLSGFMKGTGIKGEIYHINTKLISMILPGENYNTFAMSDGRNLQIVTTDPVVP